MYPMTMSYTPISFFQSSVFSVLVQKTNNGRFYLVMIVVLPFMRIYSWNKVPTCEYYNRNPFAKPHEHRWQRSGLGQHFSKQVQRTSCLCQPVTRWITFFMLKVLLHNKKMSAKLNSRLRDVAGLHFRCKLLTALQPGKLFADRQWITDNALSSTGVGQCDHLSEPLSRGVQ